VTGAQPAERLRHLPTSSGYVAGERSGLADLATGQPRRLGLPPSVQEALHRASRVPATRQYYPAAGDPELRALVVAREHGGTAFRPDAVDVLVTNGAVHALDVLLRAHLNPCDEVLVPDPGFPPYRSIVRLSGGVPVPYLLRRTATGFALDLDDLRCKVGARTRFLIVNSPHNPTGHVLGDDELHAIVELLEANPHVAYISDEVYARLAGDRAPYPSLSALSAAGILVNSLSKSHTLQGYRVGWMYGASELVANSRVVLENTIGCVSSIGQEAGKAALRADMHDLVASCRAARATAMAILDDFQVSYAVPQGAIYFFIAHGRDDAEIVAELRSAGVRVLPGAAFGCMGRGYLRATYTVPDEELLKGFRLIGQVLGGSRRAAAVRHGNP
jgi:aspartate/methionine/tyrosine aminotransferase